MMIKNHDRKIVIMIENL